MSYINVNKFSMMIKFDQNIIMKNGINASIISFKEQNYSSTFESNNVSHSMLITTKSPTIYSQQTNITNVIEYAVPFGCLVLLALILSIVTIRNRTRASNIWSTIRRMRNTNLKLFGTTLRRDSEFSFQFDPIDDAFSSKSVNEKNDNMQSEKERTIVESSVVSFV
ncbi:unnamed protein product [Didymodactylos carnosus]|uniref:Uncharacterized protein n=1 Tax=Didymodactylos carnosus TaxID=1234261 RepID=A0A814ICN9_9BILA|nr:unnamed protein product [Didymodactylos carnosus]CAF1021721.1 unnamed protein product [Didymodactylos carnosus]CAF3702621.1 unnamed protein product [Didymodactylos carnosus]CAF3793143.1 unnamed protein product [Didymodactylos carnosus]